MSFRKEEKLFIDNKNIIEFKNYLKNKNIKLLYPKRVIESLYFDNLNLDMFNDSQEGLMPRKKIRIRKYPEKKNHENYLETKVSSNEGRYKISKKISQKELSNYISRGILDNQYGLCAPKIIVKYSREYFKNKDFRVTIDTDISYKNFVTNTALKDAKIVVELKADINKDLDELLSDFSNQRTRFSKYCNAIEKLDIK